MLEYRPEGLLPGILAVHEGISAVIPHEKGSGIPLEPRPRVVSPAAHVVALNAFVVGFGLDYAQRYRNLPYIGVISFEGEEE